MVKTIHLKHAITISCDPQSERTGQIEGFCHITESGTVILTGTGNEPIIAITTTHDVHRKASVKCHALRTAELTIPSHNVAAIESPQERYP